MLLEQRQPHLRHSLDVHRVQCSNYQLAFDKYTQAASLTQRCIWINNSAASGSRIRYIWSFDLFLCSLSFVSKSFPCLPALLGASGWAMCVFAICLPLDNSRTNDRICSFNAATASSAGDKFASTRRCASCSQDALSPPPDCDDE